MEDSQGLTSVSSHSKGTSQWHSYVGRREDFLKLAKVILGDLEPTPDRIYETLLRIEQLLKDRAESS